MNKTGIELIATERHEQLGKHNKSVEFDVDFNSNGQLVLGAIKLIAHEMSNQISLAAPVGWHEGVWGKMINKPYRERLIIAGALIAAEIDRLTLVEKTSNELSLRNYREADEVKKQKIAEKAFELIHKQEEYLNLLTEEIESMATLASTHGYKRKSIEKGASIRAELAKLKEGIN